MEITKVLKVENGFKVNDQFFIPEDKDNKDYQDILEWEKLGNEIKPEFTIEQLNQKAFEDTKIDKIAQCQTYLQSTDWQIIRLSDPSTSKPVEDKILKNRAEARSLQKSIATCTTLEELNAININFD